MTPLPLVLASSSVFRKQLLSKLNLSFECEAPNIDESAHPGEDPLALALRLAEEKARALAHKYPKALLIGSDELAVREGTVLGKPKNPSHAREQLRSASGKKMIFFTSLCLLNTATGHCQVDYERWDVKFRVLTDGMIERYLTWEEPYFSAASIKAENVGIALFEEVRGSDPNALIGLPLVKLVKMLASEGIEVLS